MPNSPDTAQLIVIFDTALRNAETSLQAARPESLGPLTEKVYRAFKDAREALAAEGTLPLVGGNDPHTVDPIDDPNTKLRAALSSVYGFASKNYQSICPHSVQTMQRLQPIAAALHHRGLAIFT